jgi:multimeric flavodoxin WrbA
MNISSAFFCISSPFHRIDPLFQLSLYQSGYAACRHFSSTTNNIHRALKLNSSKEVSMKILALNSSPRGEGQSKTELMLNSLVEGMRAAGAEVEVVDLRKKKINNCAGCFSCWTKTPGTCIHKDDMTQELFPKWLESDLVVYASPLYHFSVNAELKTFIERTLPVLEPFFLQHGDRTYHPFRGKAPKIVVLSVAGLPEESVFDPLSTWVNFIFGGHNPDAKTLVAEIYRPMAEALTIPYYQEKAANILDATQQAGREIVATMNVSEETMARVKQPMVEDPAAFLEIGNLMWQTCIAEGITPREFGEKGLMPRPDSISSYIELMKLGFNPGAANGLKTTIQFNFSGENQGSCFLSIADGSINGRQGTANQPDLTVNSPFDIWMDILTGKADGRRCFSIRNIPLKAIRRC